VDEHWPHCVLLAEAKHPTADLRAYFGDSDECHMAYHFPLMRRMFSGLQRENRAPIVDAIRDTPPLPEECQWALVLRNHDAPSPGTVDEAEREDEYLAYSADPQHHLTVSLRRRLAPLVGNNRRRIELLNSFLFSLLGAPVVYYGDEIGMGDNVYLGERSGVRTPMQWTSDRNARFSRADPARLVSPVIMDPVYSYQAINVEAQERDASSLLQWMRNLIGLRKLFPAFGLGSLEFLHPPNRKVLAYVRRHGTDTILCVANLSRAVQPVELDLHAFAGLTPVEMLGYTDFPVVGHQPYFLTLGPYGFYWFELQRRDA
jgi:maltose alpha-D-glucosyltransferase/alpha-amylase